MNTIINQDSHLLPLHSQWHFPIELSPHAKEKVTAPMVFFLGGGKQIILSYCLEWLATMKGFIFLIMKDVYVTMEKLILKTRKEYLNHC